MIYVDNVWEAAAGISLAYLHMKAVKASVIVDYN
jgi:hypothetical protein